jgi:hypothetical protein
MFRKMGVMTYPYDGGVELAAIVLANLPSRLNIDKSYLIESKIVRDGETPEALAHLYYKRADLHWTLLYINSIRDPYTEWPMREGFIRTYADAKYNLNSMTTIRHLLDTRDGRVIEDAEMDAIVSSPPYPLFIHPVSYFEHEQTENNKRREIIAVSAKYILDFCDLYEDLLRGKR